MKKATLLLSTWLVLAGGLEAAWIPVGAACFGAAPACDPVDIPDDGSTLESTINGTGLPSSILGRDLRLRLYGLQHSWSGDLIVQIQNVLTGIIEPVFYQINVVSPGDFGSASNFDTAAGLNGYYEFQVFGQRNLWVFAEPPFNSDADAIDPDGSFVPSGAGSGTPIAWSGFDGINPNGQWRILIQDAAAGETGSIQGWSLDVFVAEVPEPGSFGLMLGAAATLCWTRRRTRRLN